MKTHPEDHKASELKPQFRIRIPLPVPGRFIAFYLERYRVWNFHGRTKSWIGWWKNLISWHFNFRGIQAGVGPY